jgi:hypothetical protein
VNSYLDIFIGDYSAKVVLAELARCLSLFENLHTVQIGVDIEEPLGKYFKQTFEKFSYPQIRNVFTMCSGFSFLTSCPQARRVGFTQRCFCFSPCLQSIMGNRPHLEELEDIGAVFWSSDICNRA